MYLNHCAVYLKLTQYCKLKKKQHYTSIKKHHHHPKVWHLCPKSLTGPLGVYYGAQSPSGFFTLGSGAP